MGASLKELIAREVFVTKDQERIVHTDGSEVAWLFDFRRILMRPEVLEEIAELFWKRFSDQLPIQIGGIEVASISLITAFVLKGRALGHRVNGFFIRKSRKKKGLLRMFEGALTDEPVVIVDDLLNTGSSVIRQIEALEEAGKKVTAVFVVLRFRDPSYYAYLAERGIEIISLFSLDDFSETLGLKNLVAKERAQTPMPFRAKWLFKSEHPNYFYVIPKSAPVFDEARVYFGSDSGNFWALNRTDGSVAWRYKVGFGAQGKFIFSSPVILGDLIYFGAYDGNVYALDRRTGERRFAFMDADWVGSSPAAAPDLGLIYIGLEFGLFHSQGAIAALDAATGEKRWEYRTRGLTHGSPAYARRQKVVVCGSNDRRVYGLDAVTGKLLWSFATGGEVKASIALDEERGVAAFGSFDGNLYVLDIETGALLHTIATRGPIYSTPLIVGRRVYAASLDKRLYCADLVTGEVLWTFTASGRIFASPAYAFGKIYIGANDARFYEIDPETGKATAQFQAVERITNKAAIDEATGEFFVPTFANELYCLTKNA